AVALEMIHTYSLIHDDLPSMDDDDLRRGRATSHKVYGEGLAVLAGDGLLTEGLGFLAGAAVKGGLEPNLAVAALSVIAGAAGPGGMVGGQVVDIESEGRDVGQDVVEFIHERKTGALIAASVTSGAILGRGSESRIAALEDYGRRIGLAFQIVDDILDVEGDTISLGKEAGADQARGKATFPKAAGLDRAREEAQRLVEKAVKSLEGFDAQADPLRAIAEYLLTRKK
ncbi:MAG: farnesyl diphosphate synthase, partial [Thermodesulfobacteriota bacterium]|nr:farnesyl diphosphate synthase [Thermodesulfobacteriota bacterium]